MQIAHGPCGPTGCTESLAAVNQHGQSDESVVNQNICEYHLLLLNDLNRLLCPKAPIETLHEINRQDRLQFGSPPAAN